MDQKVFDTFKKVYYITPEMTYVLKPMFTMQVQDDYVDARRTNFDSEKAFTQYLQASLAQAKASAKDAAAEVEKAAQGPHPRDVRRPDHSPHHPRRHGVPRGRHHSSPVSLNWGGSIGGLNWGQGLKWGRVRIGDTCWPQLGTGTN